LGPERVLSHLGTSSILAAKAVKSSVADAVLEHDTDNGCLYLRASGNPVARTVSLSDLVMVDLDDAGEVVGVELAMDTRRWRTNRP
jgi:uncharacterized protein YuzE